MKPQNPSVAGLTVTPSEDSIRAAPVFSNYARVTADPQGNFTIYFFAVSGDLVDLPEVKKQLDQPGLLVAPVVSVQLPAAVKLVVPSSLIPSLIQVLAQTLSGWQAQHGQGAAA